MNPSPLTPADPAPTPADPAPSSRRSRRRSALLMVAIVPVSLLLLAGCGRLRHRLAAPTTTAPVTTVAPSSSTPTSASPSTTADAAGENQTLDSISQQLATVDSSLNAVNGDLQTANSAINSQEGDPSK